MDLLAGHRFQVASHGVAAAYAGWLLRQYGADVVHTTALDAERLGAFLGEGARYSAHPDVDGEDGAVLISDAPVSASARERMARLAATRPVVWITPWGSEGEWSERPWSDLILHAAGGWMSAVGEPGREPLGPPGAQGQFVAGLFATIAALSLTGQQAPAGLRDVSMLESVVATTIYDSVAFQYYGTIRERAGNVFSPAHPLLATLPCKDGYIGIHSPLHRQWLTFCSLIGHPELPSDERFASPIERAANTRELYEYVLPWFAERTRWQAYHELQQARIPCSGHPDMAEVLASPQLAARGSWRDVTTGAGKSYRVPGPPARVLATTQGISPGATADRTKPLRVVDLSMGWAGPMVGYMLAALGADVVKVESHTHFDWWRGSRPPGDDLGLALWERSHVFNTINRGKRGVALNLTTEAGRELALKLIAGADVVIENYGAGVLERMGLPWEAMNAANPSLVVVRLPGFGGSGPESGYFSFGNTIEGMSGLSSLLGYPGGPPTQMSNGFGDPVGGLNGTVAVLAALRARERDGRGRLVEGAQLELFLPLVSEGLIEYQATGTIPPRRGNRRPGSAASGVFACAGDDEWLAIDVRGEAEWARLADAAGLGEGERELGLAGWTAAQSRTDAEAVCLGAGVAAVPVHNEAELLGLDPLMSPPFWQGQERAYVGFHQYPGVAIRVGDSRPEASRPAPTLGEHTAEVLAEIGIEQSELERLAAEGVIGTVPPG